MNCSELLKKGSSYQSLIYKLIYNGILFMARSRTSGHKSNYAAWYTLKLLNSQYASLKAPGFAATYAVQLLGHWASST